jgi:hypothetical protein
MISILSVLIQMLNNQHYHQLSSFLKRFDENNVIHVFNNDRSTIFTKIFLNVMLILPYQTLNQLVQEPMLKHSHRLF